MLKNYNGIMIVSDLDGTLLGRNLVSDQDKEAKKYFEEKGGIFTVATGRSLKSAKCVLKDVRINAPAILNNGPLIKNMETLETLKVSFLPLETRDILNNLLNVFPDLSFEIYCEDIMYLVNPNETAEWHMRHEDINYERRPLDNVPDKWAKAVLIHKPEIMTKVATYMYDKGFPFKQIWSEGSIFNELININADKGAGVLDIAKYYGISRSNVICVGDGPNDIGMIKAAGCGLAVGNACEELKKAADHVIVTNKENPLSYIVKNIEDLLSKAKQTEKL